MDTQEVTTNVEAKRWKPKLFSNYALIIGGAGVIFITLAAISLLLSKFDLSSLPDYLKTLFTNDGSFFLLGGVLLLIAGLIETFSRLRTPPPTWRVREELIRAMGDLGLLELNDKARWQGKFSVAPIGKYNKHAKCFTVPFLLRNVNATEDKFKSMEKSIAGFARSVDCTIEQDNTKKFYNFRLVLWYANPYENIDEINPFN